MSFLSEFLPYMDKLFLDRQLSSVVYLFTHSNGHNCYLKLVMTTSHIFYFQDLWIFSSSSAFGGMPPQLHGRPNSLGRHATSYHVDKMVNLALPQRILHSQVFTLVACLITHHMKLPLQKGSTLFHIRKVIRDIYIACRKVITSELPLGILVSDQS